MNLARFSLVTLALFVLPALVRPGGRLLRVRGMPIHEWGKKTVPLAAIMLDFIRQPDKVREYGCAARENAETEFSLSAIAEHYRDLYLGLSN